MTTKRIQPVNNFLRALLLVCAAAGGLVAGACADEDDENGATSVRAEMSCQDYCDRAKLCDDETNIDNCIDKCLDRIDDCMADEQEAALDQIDVCSTESCDDFTGCTINAGAQCYFGL